MLKWIKNKIANKAPDAAIPVADLVPPQTRPSQTVKGQGDEHVKAGRYADAERCYRQVMESDAHYPGAVVMLGFVLREQGRTDEAREALERAVLIAPEDADSHYLLGSVLEATGPRNLEISHLQKAVDLRPNFELARRQLIVALLKSGRVADATALCEASIATLPNSAELHFYRGNLHVHADEKTLAIASCRRALSLNPEFIAAQQSLSRLLLDTEQFEQAEISYRREIELTPVHFGPYHMLGVVLHRMARHAEAIELFKRAIALNPSSSASYSSLGAAYIDLDDTSEDSLALAQANFERAVALEPGSSESHYTLGVNYWRRAQPDRALASFDRAIEANPDNVKAKVISFHRWVSHFRSHDYLFLRTKFWLALLLLALFSSILLALISLLLLMLRTISSKPRLL